MSRFTDWCEIYGTLVKIIQRPRYKQKISFVCRPGYCRIPLTLYKEGQTWPVFIPPSPEWQLCRKKLEIPWLVGNFHQQTWPQVQRTERRGSSYTCRWSSSSEIQFLLLSSSLYISIFCILPFRMTCCEVHLHQMSWDRGHHHLGILKENNMILFTKGQTGPCMEYTCSLSFVIATHSYHEW